MLYVGYCTVDRVFEKEEVLRTWKEGDETKQIKRSLGWFMQIGDAAIGLGEDKPDIADGDKIKIAISKVNQNG